MTVLLGDVHSSIHDSAVPFDLHDKRVAYYDTVLRGLIAPFNAPLKLLNFKVASEYQLRAEFTLDVYKLSSLVSLDDAKKGVFNVALAPNNTASMGHLLYPCLQVSSIFVPLGSFESHMGVDRRSTRNITKQTYNLAGSIRRTCLPLHGTCCL